MGRMNDGSAWDLVVAKDDFARTEIRPRLDPQLEEGQALLRVDRVGVTANNVTYASMGESMGYWDFFPAEEGWGRVPLWGFADVVASEAPEVAEGTRVYGYLPTSSHLVVRPDRADGDGFRDASENRMKLPSSYNVYSATAKDPAYEADHEDLQILYRPLFITSFVLDDFLAEKGFFGADSILVSSASSKTSYGTAFCLKRREDRPRIVGLTSARNLGFTESLGCYDEVLTYALVQSLPSETPSLYIDMAGSMSLRTKIHDHLGSSLVYDAVVGATHPGAILESTNAQSGPPPTLFFAPDQIKKRRADWGPRGVETHYGEAWREFVPAVKGWVDVVVGEGPESLRAAWLEVAAGRVDPRVGHVVSV